MFCGLRGVFDALDRGIGLVDNGKTFIHDFFKDGCGSVNVDEETLTTGRYVVCNVYEFPEGNSLHRINCKTLLGKDGTSHTCVNDLFFCLNPVTKVPLGSWEPSLNTFPFFRGSMLK